MQLAEDAGFEPTIQEPKSCAFPLGESSVLPSLPAVKIGFHNLRVRRREPLSLEVRIGFEPTTCRLQGGCSTD